MTARPPRRAALAGSAAALLGLGAPGALAAAVDGKSPATALATSPEARALQAEAGRLSREYREACREVDRTGDLVDYFDPPEAVFERPGDRRLFFAWLPTSAWPDEARLWWTSADNIDRLRGASFRYLSGGQDEAAIARRDEILKAADEWKAADKAAEDAVGYTAAGLRYDAAHDAYAAFRARLVETRLPAAGLAVCAMAAEPISRQAAAASARRDVFDMVSLLPEGAPPAGSTRRCPRPAGVNRGDGGRFRPGRAMERQEVAR